MKFSITVSLIYGPMELLELLTFYLTSKNIHYE